MARVRLLKHGLVWLAFTQQVETVLNHANLHVPAQFINVMLMWYKLALVMVGLASLFSTTFNLLLQSVQFMSAGS